MKTLLFLCTGNYYRSRFAEFYFRHLAAEHQLDGHVDSRGLQLHSENEGPLSHHTIHECHRLGISTEPLRLPVRLQEADLVRAKLTIAVTVRTFVARERRNWPRRFRCTWFAIGSATAKQ